MYVEGYFSSIQLDPFTFVHCRFDGAPVNARPQTTVPIGYLWVCISVGFDDILGFFFRKYNVEVITILPEPRSSQLKSTAKYSGFGSLSLIFEVSYNFAIWPEVVVIGSSIHMIASKPNID